MHKRILLAAMLAAFGWVDVASAAETNTSANAGSQSAAGAGAQAIAISGAGGNAGYSGGTNNTTTLITTPTVYAPSVVGGNTCAVGASGAASFLGFGAALGGTWADPDCERRMNVAMLWNMGHKMEAMELACDFKPTYVAVRRTAARLAHVPGYQPSCASRPEWEPKVATVAAPAVPVVPPPPPRQRFNPSVYATMENCLSAAGSIGDPANFGLCKQQFPSAR